MAGSVAERSTTTATILSAGAAGGLTAEHHRHARRRRPPPRRPAGRLDRRRRRRHLRRRLAGRRCGGRARSSASPRRPTRALRIGIAAGDVTWEDGECAGLPVVIAARLQVEAGDGEILVSHVVRLLAGDRLGERCEPVGPLRLDGVPGPTDAFAVGWRRPTAARRRRRSRRLRCRSPGATPAVTPSSDGPRRWPRSSGRGRWPRPERARSCCSAARSAPARRGWRRSSAAPSTAPAVPCCSGPATTTSPCPYQPWVQAVDQLLATLDPTSVGADLAARLAPLSQLAVHLDARRPVAGRRRPMDPEAARYRLYEAFVVALDEAAARWPTVVVLDDLHWAGAQTLALLRHLARTGLPGRLLVVGTFRDTSDELTEPLAACLADLRRVEAVTRLRLDALDGAAVERFVADAVGHPLDADLTGAGRRARRPQRRQRVLRRRAVAAPRGDPGGRPDGRPLVRRTTSPRRRRCPTASARSSPRASPG